MLSVIALITVPVVTKVMNDSRKNSFKVSAENLVEAANNYYADNQLSMDKTLTFNFALGGKTDTGIKLSYQGAHPTGGRLVLNMDGGVSLIDINNGKYYANYDSTGDDKVIVTETNEVLTRDELTQAIKDIRKDLNVKNTEVKEIKDKLVTKDNEVKELKDKLVTKDNEVKQIKNDLLAKDTEINKLKGTIETLNNNKLDKTSFEIRYLGNWSNINDYHIRSGIYGVYGASNPIDGGIATLEVVVYSEDWALQRLTIIYSGAVYERRYYGGTTWSGWVQRH